MKLITLSSSLLLGLAAAAPAPQQLQQAQQVQNNNNSPRPNSPNGIGIADPTSQQGSKNNAKPYAPSYQSNDDNTNDLSDPTQNNKPYTPGYNSNPNGIADPTQNSQKPPTYSQDDSSDLSDPIQNNKPDNPSYGGNSNPNGIADPTQGNQKPPAYSQGDSSDLSDPTQNNKPYAPSYNGNSNPNGIADPTQGNQQKAPTYSQDNNDQDHNDQDLADPTQGQSQNPKPYPAVGIADPTGKNYDDAYGGECISQQDAQEFVRRYNGFLTQRGSDLGNTYATAQAIISDDFAGLYSSSIRSVMGMPGNNGPIYNNKQDFINTVSKGPMRKIDQTLEVIPACDRIVWYFIQATGSAKYPAWGFALFTLERNKDNGVPSDWQATRLNIEFDSLAWAVNDGAEVEYQNGTEIGDKEQDDNDDDDSQRQVSRISGINGGVGQGQQFGQNQNLQQSNQGSQGGRGD